jgi:PBSX family phage terminase large subunit
VAAGNFYRAYGAASALWRCRDGEVLISGPAGTGKSKACLEKLNACALQFPGMRGLIVRKTRESLTESALVTFEERVLPANDPIALGVKRSNRHAYDYPNGSTIVVAGLRQAGRDVTQKVMSTDYDMAYVQEAVELSEDDWERLTTRLRNGVMPFQQLLADTNPDTPTHWLKRRCDAGQATLLESRHEDNPLLWDHKVGSWTEAGRSYIAKLDALTGPRKLRLRHGRWVQAEGVVYEEFDRDVHLIDEPVGPFRRYVAGVDWGYTNPGVIEVFGIDGDGRMTLVREVYRTRRLIGWWVAKAAEIHARLGIETFQCDPSEPAYIEQFRAAGLPAFPADNDIGIGIQAVQERLKAALDGRPRLTFLRDVTDDRDADLVEAKKPTGVVEEFDSYVWQTAANGKPLKEVPVDMNNHGMDALRYVALHLGRPAVGSPAVAGHRSPIAAHIPGYTPPPMGGQKAGVGTSAVGMPPMGGFGGFGARR